VSESKKENENNGIVVTKAMIEAGVTEFFSWIYDEDCNKQIVSAIFTEMAKVQSDL